MRASAAAKMAAAWEFGHLWRVLTISKAGFAGHSPEGEWRLTSAIFTTTGQEEMSKLSCSRPAALPSPACGRTSSTGQRAQLSVAPGSSKPILQNVRLISNALRLGLSILLVLLAAGCAGFGASGSVSPATFLLPGLGSNTLDRMPFEPSTAAQPAAQVIARAD